MARGITETDVFIACDALLLAGERPTIERVRQKIGRGSPNTVSPMLDAWFKGLGRRLQDPGAFTPPPDVPDPVLQAAQHFWEVAQSQARGDFEQAVADALAPHQLQLEEATQAVAALRADAEAQTLASAALRRQLDDAHSRLEAERMAHAATSALLESAHAQHDELRGRIAASEAALTEVREQARSDIDAAHERATGAERRAALEIEGERTARGRAEKRADLLEKRIEALQTESRVGAAAQLAELAAARAALEVATGQLTDQRQLAAAATVRVDIAEAALLDTRLARERAEGHAYGLLQTLSRLEQLIVKPDARRAVKSGRAAKP